MKTDIIILFALLAMLAGVILFADQRDMELRVVNDRLAALEDHMVDRTVPRITVEGRAAIYAGSGEIINFERRMDVESFIIQLQSMFVRTYERDNLLKFLGRLKSGFSKEMKDNGISQTVTAKTGVTMVSDVEVPNPVTLKPYRTFSEIDQPASDFVFRIHTGQDEPTCALYEADGGAWKLKAIEWIADWLKEKLPDIAVIA